MRFVFLSTFGVHFALWTVKAIVAQSLSMNLAYPQIQESLIELLGSTGPEFGFVAPGSFDLIGKSLPFGTVQHMFHLAYQVSDSVISSHRCKRNFQKNHLSLSVGERGHSRLFRRHRAQSGPFSR